jgi:DNA-binding NtrC family response regulator
MDLPFSLTLCPKRGWRLSGSEYGDRPADCTERLLWAALMEEREKVRALSEAVKELSARESAPEGSSLTVRVTAPPPTSSVSAADLQAIRHAAEEDEIALYRRAIERYKGCLVHAAKALGLSYGTFCDRVRTYGLHPKPSRPASWTRNTKATRRRGEAAVQNARAARASAVRAALERYGWHKGRAATALGISRNTLYVHMKELGIQDTRPKWTKNRISAGTVLSVDPSRAGLLIGSGVTHDNNKRSHPYPPAENSLHGR